MSGIRMATWLMVAVIGIACGSTPGRYVVVPGARPAPAWIHGTPVPPHGITGCAQRVVIQANGDLAQNPDIVRTMARNDAAAALSDRISSDVLETYNTAKRTVAAPRCRDEPQAPDCAAAAHHVRTLSHTIENISSITLHGLELGDEWESGQLQYYALYFVSLANLQRTLKGTGLEDTGAQTAAAQLCATSSAASAAAK